MGVKIINPGALLTVQDGGRRGYQRYGISESGAADRESMAIANIIVGNSMDEAVLEAALMGPMIEFTSDGIIALTGADMSPEINGSGCEMYRALKVMKGDVLSFKGLKNGLRTYIAFAGGLKVVSEVGSASTDIRAGLGGLEGRALRSGDEISFKDEEACLENIGGRAIGRDRELNGVYELRVVLGPEEDRFTEKGKRTFFGSEYVVDASSDRMGVRLNGEKIEHSNGADIISNGIPFGGIQVADNGQPMIMLSDRQTTGGYTKIGCVASVDIPLIAQAAAGDRIRFSEISVDEAQELMKERDRYYEKLKTDLDSSEKDAPGPSQRYRVMVNGRPFILEVESK